MQHPASSIHSPVSSLDTVPGLSARTAKMLFKAGLCRVMDLLEHYPRRYENRLRFPGFPHEETAEAVCVRGFVTDCGLRRFGYRKYAEITVQESVSGQLGGSIKCRWFNMPWIAKAFAAGQEIILFGQVKWKKPGLVIDHPDFEIVDPEDISSYIHMGRLVPVYPLGDGLSQKPLREAMHLVLESLNASEVEEVLPREPEGSDGAPGISRAEALRAIHFPESIEALDVARRRLALEEFFVLQLNVLERRQRIRGQPGFRHAPSGSLLTRWESALDFPLTDGQRRSISEVRADMAESRPMNRLLQGDVGSGKTFVAMAAALMAAESGSQTAIMAPTQILAEQHFLTLQRHLGPLGVRIRLRTSARDDDSILPLFGGGAPPQVIVGTHALLFDDSLFENLSLVVIDEQHKFGVAQRARLTARDRVPDLLIMTATPIPRTLALTLYGDLDVSVLDEMPAGRGRITTAVRSGADLDQITRFLKHQLSKGRQAFIVYPLVEESDALAVKAAVAEYAGWTAHLPGVAVGLLHGRLKPEQKEAVMAAFHAGELKVLVSTTVIEVGIDVPNATLMLVFHADRFGLAQLHQLRGRIGRGPYPSHCILLCSEEALHRLRVLEQTNDGFKIAEADLELRGPGELLGSKQSGLPTLRLGNLAADAPLVHRARSLAATLLAEDPTLSLPQNHRFRELLTAAGQDTAAN